MKKLIIILFISLAFQVARSQSSVSQQLVGSGGGQTDNATFHTSWSVGESVTATASAGSLLLTQGFQQRNCENPTTPGVIGAAQTICYNSKPAAFANVTLPGNLTGTPEYQWQKSTTDNSSGFSDISGATDTVYTETSNLTQNTWYKRKVKVTCESNWKESNVIQVTVYSTFSAGAIATTGETICYNGNPSQIANETAASGGDNAIGYQWQSSTTSGISGFADIGSATGSTYDPPTGLTSTTWYRRMAKDGTCNTTFTASTGVWQVTVRPNFTTGAIKTTGETICYNGDPSLIGSATAASGGDNVISYQWQKQVVESDFPDPWINISGATDATYDPPSGLTSSTKYRRQAKDGTCNTAFTISTGVWQVTVRPEFTPGAITITGENICYNSDPAIPIGNTTSGSGGDNVISYSWRSSADSYATAISGATGSTYLPSGPLTATTSYRRYANEGTCNLTPMVSTGTWTVTVLPPSSGGAVTGGTDVCYGTNSTLLTLSGHTGAVLKWQYSTDNTNWTDISSSTQTTYTAENLVVDTWYRAVVENIPCSEVNSDATKITIKTGFTISGYAKYENNPKTPLNGLKITLKKDGSPFGTPVTTGNNGYYEFTGLEQGNYGIEIASAHPSGQWQTWSGVNNTDYLLVSKHIAGTQYLPVNPPVVRTSASVKLPHPAINNTDATAIRQAAKFPTTGYTYFDTAKWVFSGIDATQALTGIALNCANVVRDIRGLCAGDVNGTYVPPSGYKTAVETLHATSLQLQHRGTLPLSDELIFPIRVDRDMELGAITLFLDFDPSVMIVTNVTNVTTVTTVTNGSELWYNVKEPTLNLKPSTLNTLQIGWMSPDPVTVAEGQAVILVHARLRDGANPIRFTLNENPDSELADADGNVIPDVKLVMPTGENGKTVQPQNGKMEIVSVYPNPAKETVKIELITGSDGPLNLELFNLQGISIMKTVTGIVPAGWHKEVLDVSKMVSGVYMLKVTCGDQVTIRKVAVNR